MKKSFHLGHYILVGKTIKDVPLLEWAKWFEKNRKERIIKQSVLVNGRFVSTVFLGIDYGFGGPKPIVFETMVFPKRGDWSELDMNRYSTYDEAVRGHNKMVRKWRNHV